MSPDAQQIAIAKACGWSYQNKHPRFGKQSVKSWYFMNTEITVSSSSKLPDYLNDLNAMHEAEKVLNPDQQKQFIEYLIEGETHDEYCTEMLWDSSWIAAHATAAQRAEAFLRTVGKWEGVE